MNQNLEVATSIDEPFVLEKDAAEALAESVGMVKVTTREFKALRIVGDHVKGLDPLRVQRGQALISQTRLNKACNAILELILEMKEECGKAKAKEIAMLGTTLATLTSKLTDSQHFSANIEGANHGPTTVTVDDPPKFKTLAPGQQLVIAREAHIHPPASS